MRAGSLRRFAESLIWQLYAAEIRVAGLMPILLWTSNGCIAWGNQSSDDTRGLAYVLDVTALCYVLLTGTSFISFIINACGFSSFSCLQ